jgi:hypothetical protein
MLSCVGFDMKEPMDTYLTTPPPEDLGRRQLAIDLAEDALIQDTRQLAAKPSFSHFSAASANSNSSSPPEDLSRQQLAIDLAEDAFIQAEFVLADAARSGPSADVDAASATRDAARRALADAEQPLKFVTNFCYAGDSTVKMFHLIQNWHHCVPRNITCSDDECNMYGECDREDCLGWLREFCPMLLPCVRFF